MIISKPSKIDKQTVGCILLYKNKYLLVHRVKDNLWGSVAGSTHQGESPQEAIERELKEELNLKIRPTFFATTYHQYGKENVAYHLFIHEFKEDPQKSITLNEESYAHRWLTLEEVKKLPLFEDELYCLELVHARF